MKIGVDFMQMWMLYQDSDEQTGGTPPSLDVTVPTYSTNQFNTSVEKKGMLEKKTEGKQNEIQIKALTVLTLILLCTYS